MVTECIPPQPRVCGCGVLITGVPGRKTPKYCAECVSKQNTLYRATVLAVFLALVDLIPWWVAGSATGYLVWYLSRKRRAYLREEG